MNIIYALRDPITDEYMYVGKSIQGVLRAKQHLVYSHNILVRDWVMSLNMQEKQPLIDILEECDNPLLLSEKEKFWINKLNKEGHPLLNIIVYDSLVDRVQELNRLKKEFDIKIQNYKNKINNANIYNIKDLSILIKKRRNLAKLSRTQLAELAGVGKTVIYDIEHNKKTVRMDILFKILKTLNIKFIFYVDNLHN